MAWQSTHALAWGIAFAWYWPVLQREATVGIMVAFEKAMVWQVVQVCVDTCAERWRIAKRVIVVTSACVLAMSG